MKIATWNVNSVRARLDHVERWLSLESPDVLCLQETKVVDDDFPTEVFSRLGYAVAYAGQKTYNGVAIASRLPMTDVTVGLIDRSPEDDQRLISATIDGVRVYSAYVPNGKNLDSPSYPEKLAWLGRLRQTLEKGSLPIALLGDFNIATDDRDVPDPERMRGQIHFSAPEHAALKDVLSPGLFDAFRATTDEGQLFTWWDYRMGAFRRNRGLRIDYVFLSDALRPRLASAAIDKTPRAWEKPSDHTPVVVQLS